MTTTPNHGIPLPADGQTPWGDDYRDGMTIVDSRLPRVGGSMFVEDNATPTVISATNTPTLATIPTQEGPPCPCVTHSPNRLTVNFQNGPRLLLIVGSFVVSSGSNNQTLRVTVRKNGQPIPGAVAKVRKGAAADIGSGALAASVVAEAGDFFEVWVSNESSAADVTFSDMTLALRG